MLELTVSSHDDLIKIMFERTDWLSWMRKWGIGKELLKACNPDSILTI